MKTYNLSVLTACGKCSKKWNDARKRNEFFDEEGCKINLGYDWVRVLNVGYPDIFEIMTVQGYGIGPLLKGNHRCDDDFVESSFALIDIDNGMQLSELGNHDFYRQFGAGYYTTPSHTEQHHKFRIIHVLENPITSVEDMRMLYQGIQNEYSASDTICRDAARFFYGTKNCRQCERIDNILSQSKIDELIQWGKDVQKRVPPPIERKLSDNQRSEQMRTVLKLLGNPKATITIEPHWEIYRNLLWSLRFEGFDFDDVMVVADNLIGGYGNYIDESERIWNDGANKTMSFGVVINYLNLCYYQGVVKNPPYWL